MMPIASSGVVAGGGLTRPERLPEVARLAIAPVPSDEELLAGYQAGRREPLEELFRRYRLIAYRVAYRLLGNEADALDAVQDGFVKVLVHLETFQKRSSFKTWLLRVISNAALDLGRQRGRQDLLTLVPEAEECDGPQPVAQANPSLGLERAELRHLLDEALAILPEAQRRTFVLHADAELSYREVADVMGISIGTVMSRLYYARQKLRAFLTRRVPEEVRIADCVTAPARTDSKTAAIGRRS